MLRSLGSLRYDKVVFVFRFFLNIFLFAKRLNVDVVILSVRCFAETIFPHARGVLF